MSLELSKGPNGTIIVSCGGERLQIGSGIRDLYYLPPGVEPISILVPETPDTLTFEPVYPSEDVVIVQVDGDERIELKPLEFGEGLRDMIRSLETETSRLSINYPSRSIIDLGEITTKLDTRGMHAPLTLRFRGDDE